MSDKPMAALIRENEFLRNVASAAIKVRRIGQLADKYQENLEALWEERPDMTKSGTGGIMYAQAFETALQRFDETVLKAAAAEMDWAADHKIRIKSQPSKQDQP